MEVGFLSELLSATLSAPVVPDRYIKLHYNFSTIRFLQIDFPFPLAAKNRLEVSVRIFLRRLRRHQCRSRRNSGDTPSTTRRSGSLGQSTVGRRRFHPHASRPRRLHQLFTGKYRKIFGIFHCIFILFSMRCCWISSTTSCSTLSLTGRRL